MNTLKCLRKRNGYSMSALAEKTGISPTDIVRLERRNTSCSLKKYKTMADFFGISISALLQTDICELTNYVLANPDHLSCSEAWHLQKQLKCIESGNAGEDAALVYEVLRHIEADSPYLEEIDPSASEDAANHCDIWSRTLDGKRLYIEVKATVGGLEAPFHISTSELEKAVEVEKEGDVYMVYRVIYSKDEERRQVIPMTLAEIYGRYTIAPTNFILKAREG